jgi:hypothetical protein
MQEPMLLGGLHAFGDHLQFEALPERDDRLRDGHVLLRAEQVAC